LIQKSKKRIPLYFKKRKDQYQCHSTKDLLNSPKALPFLATFILSTKQFENLNTYKEDQEE
jgi:hypothetical protein